MTPRFPRRGTPESFGCVRVPDRDHFGWLCWELPGGVHVYLHHSVGRLVQVAADVLPEADTEAVRR